MAMDIRAEAALYYDLSPAFPNDIAFYKNRIPSPDATVLELGCGTGRVLLSLAKCCSYIHGLDNSEAMLAICEKKLAEASIPRTKAAVQQADITRFRLGRTFDLIIAPYHVFQNLETDDEVDGLFGCVREHLAPEGSCLLNVFHTWDRERLRQAWGGKMESFCWEVPVDNGRLTCHERRREIDLENLVIYPEAIYRRYEADALVDEATLKIAMRCYYPQQFEELILQHGFAIVNRWGGYADEPYVEGPELVIEFKERG